MDSSFYGILLSRQAEGIPAHRMQYVEPPHPLVPRDDIGGGVPLKVADVKPRTGWIGEHVEAVKFQFSGIVRDAKRPVFVPVLLPFRLDCAVVVPFTHRNAIPQRLAVSRCGISESNIAP